MGKSRNEISRAMLEELAARSGAAVPEELAKMITKMAPAYYTGGGASLPIGVVKYALDTGVMQKFNVDVEYLNVDDEMTFRPGLSRGDPRDKIIADLETQLRNIRNDMNEAQGALKEMTTLLENIQKEPLILFRIDRMSKDNKYCYVKKQDTDLRIETVPDLAAGDEVLLHPKSYQIVERIGKPPLEVSRFAPDKIPDVKWEDIGGLEEAKADLIEAIELPHKNKDLFKFYGKKQIKGILLSGPPGCGKTMLGKAAANSLATIYGKENSRTGFLYVKGPEILNQYVGQTEQTIRDMFEDARRHHEENGYPAIIFLDEADAILAARGTRNVGIGNTIVPQFLTEMDGLEESSAIVIIATNRPDVLDPAIVRDGRIDRKVTVTRPTIKSASEILLIELKRVPVQRGMAEETMALDVAELIFSEEQELKGDSLLRDVVNGAMLTNVINIAVSHAIRRDMKECKSSTGSGITMADLSLAVDRVCRQARGVRHDLVINE